MAQSAAVLAGTLGWALAWNACDPQGLALATPLPRRAANDPSYVDHATAARLWRESPATVFVDVRHRAAWRQGHLPGAIHLPAEGFDEAWLRVGARLRPTDDLVLYCDGPHCDIARHTRDRLVGLGFQRVRIYEGGWMDWHASGLERATEDP
jgi:rhodanese-related sulfurtransferase